MAPNRIMRGRRVRRALAPRVVALALAAGLGACGGSGGDADAPEKAADAKVLNAILAPGAGRGRRLHQALPALRGADLALAAPLPRPGAGTRRRDHEGDARPRRRSRPPRRNDRSRRAEDRSATTSPSPTNSKARRSTPTSTRSTS